MYSLFSTLGSIFSQNRKTGRSIKAKRQPTTRPILEVLEDRLCPAGTWYWSVQGGPGNWSTPGNWKNANNVADTQPPQPGDTCVFDPNKSQFACVIDQNTNAANVTLQTGYRTVFMVNDGVTWHIANFTDNDPGTDSFTVQYKSNKNTTQISFEGNDRVYNFNVTDLGSKGQTAVNNNGTLTMGAGNNNGNAYSISMVDPLIVSAGATLNIGDSQGDGAVSKVNWNDNSNITVYGTLNFFALKDKSATLLTNFGGNGYIDVASSQAGNGNIVFINTDPGKDATQSIGMGILQEAGSIKVSGDYWNIYNAVNNGQPKLDDVIISGGTFTLGNKGSSDGVIFNFRDNFLMDQWNSKGGTGFLDVVQNSTLANNTTPAGGEIDLITPACKLRTNWCYQSPCFWSVGQCI